MRPYPIFLLLILSISLSACAATGPGYLSVKSNIPQLASGKARLYFMRDTGFMGSGSNARIQVNGIDKPDLAMGGFFYTDEDPGNIFIMVDGGQYSPGDAKLTLKAEEGQTYYFFVEPNTGNIMTGALFGILGSAARGDGIYKFYQIPEKMALEKLKTKKSVSSFRSGASVRQVG